MTLERVWKESLHTGIEEIRVRGRVELLGADEFVVAISYDKIVGAHVITFTYSLDTEPLLVREVKMRLDQFMDHPVLCAWVRGTS